MVKLAGVFVDDVEAFLGLLLGHDFRRELNLLYFDSILAGKVSERIRVAEVLVLHDELGGVPRLAAAEAFEDVLGR